MKDKDFDRICSLDPYGDLIYDAGDVVKEAKLSRKLNKELDAEVKRWIQTCRNYEHNRESLETENKELKGRIKVLLNYREMRGWDKKEKE